ncbi:EAL domain-containing protein [Peribacillus sp. SCS-37]|uniref:EAL domain-containing protein n=1 Tax=Paraperibacillus esterisolvens TaxID=3115296 RepID=UPI003905D354
MFNIKNRRQIAEELGEERFGEYLLFLKASFAEVIKMNILRQDILAVHDYNSDGITLILKMNSQKQVLDDIDAAASLVLEKAQAALEAAFPDVSAQFDSGYMFVEKNAFTVSDALSRAHRQAGAMAEQKIHTEFNQMLFQMGRIVEKKDIRLLSQPIIDVASQRIKAHEILTRGPRGTMLESPLALFTVARQTNRLYDLEMIVLEKSFEHISSGEDPLDVFINFTPVTLGSSRFVKDMMGLLDKYKKVSPVRIVIEVTERDNIDEIAGLPGNIKELKELGFRIAVDDTGAGYASLHTISEIMPDIIKIDRTVIRDIHHNTVKESMLKGLLLIAREAGSVVVAEGIETEEEASVLTRNKVDLAQGYFYAKPAKMAHA